MVFLRRNWVLLVQLSLQGRGFFSPLVKRIVRELHLCVPQQHHPSPSLTPFMAHTIAKPIKNLLSKQQAAEEASTKMNADPSLESESQCSMPLPQSHPRFPGIGALWRRAEAQVLMQLRTRLGRQGGGGPAAKAPPSISTLLLV